MFAVRIDVGSESARQDWRSDYDALTYAPMELPGDTAAVVVALHQRLGVYGAVDLIGTTSDEMVLLETTRRWAQIAP